MRNKGFSLVEAVVAISIVASFIVILTSVNTLYLKTALSQSSKMQASFLAEEGIEAVRFLRDSGWTANMASIARGVPYYAVFTGSGWQLSGSPSSIGIFTRAITFGDVYRDPNDDITDLGGVLDPDTLLVEIEVSWQEQENLQSRTLSTYLTNFLSN